MKLRKIIYCIFITLILTCMGISWWLGSYFVDFALKRGTAQDPKALPHASFAILSANLPPHPRPDFSSTEWTLSMKGEKRVATAFYAREKTNKWVILVHGYCRDQRYTWYYADVYLRNGYNVLTPDLNASGGSEGQYLTMGVKESDDIVGWSRKLAAEAPNARIALHGVSMGAATVLMAAQKALPQQVYAVVEDCGYTSAYDMFSMKLKEMFGLPEFPVLGLVNVVGRVKTGIYLSEAAPIKKLADCRLPMLFIHGDKDKLIPVAMVDELYGACKANVKEKYIAKGAGHARSMSTNPEVYFKKVFAFLNKAAAVKK